MLEEGKSSGVEEHDHCISTSPLSTRTGNAIWMENVRQKDGRAREETEGMTSREEDPDEPDLGVGGKGFDLHEVPVERERERERGARTTGLC